MFDIFRLKEVLIKYKENFVSKQWPNEKYKWEAVKCFQDNWDVNAPDFADMLTRSLAKTDNLLASMNNFPAKMIQGFAKVVPEEVRAMYIALFDESQDVVNRILKFKNQSSILLEKYGNGAGQHYQYENAVSTYLWLRYPEKYYIYKYGEVKTVADELGSDYRFKKGAYADNLRNFLALYDEIRAELKNDGGLINLLNSQITDSCNADTELCTLTIDIGFYISRTYSSGTSDLNVDEARYLSNDISQHEISEKMVNGWLLSWNPQKWVWDDFDDVVQIIESGGAYCIDWTCANSHVQVGDGVFFSKLGGEPRGIIASGYIISDIDIDKHYDVEKNSSVNYVTIILNEIIDYRECSILTTKALKQKYPDQCWSPQSSGIKIKDHILPHLIADWKKMFCHKPLESDTGDEEYDKDAFLDDVYMTESKYDTLVAVLKNKKNIILQGAPGVGKTFAAKRLAYSIMGEKDESRIEFVQFHQNYSYEDFMMGYKPVNDGFELKYGVFYRFCQKAANQPDKDFFFIIDEINRGNMSKIFGELLMLIERDYRGTKATLAYNGMTFSVPKNLYIIGMMNTADHSLAMIDYALRRRFSFFDIEPGFESAGFMKYQQGLNNETFSLLVSKVQELNKEITLDKSLGKGFCIGHSYFCGQKECTDEWMQAIVDYEILPMLSEYWFDDVNKLQRWENILRGVFQ